MLRACDRVVELGPGAGAAGRRTSSSTAARGARGRDLRDGARPRARRARDAGRTRSSARAHAIDGARGQQPARRHRRRPARRRGAPSPAPSGSGKSTLVEEVLFRGLARARGYRDVEAAGRAPSHRGRERHRARRCSWIRPRSGAPRAATRPRTPARGTAVRALFAQQPRGGGARAHAAATSPSTWRSAAARRASGEGSETIEMQFLADVRARCARRAGAGASRTRCSRSSSAARSVADVLGALRRRGARRLRATKPAIVRGARPARQARARLPARSGSRSRRSRAARRSGSSWRGRSASARAGTLVILDEPSAGPPPDEVGRAQRRSTTWSRAGAQRGRGRPRSRRHPRAPTGSSTSAPAPAPTAGAVVAKGTPEDDRARRDTRTGSALAR